jgi:hypothetical protein
MDIYKINIKITVYLSAVHHEKSEVEIQTLVTVHGFRPARRIAGGVQRFRVQKL